MNVAQIEENIKLLFSSPLKDDYIFDILRIYGLPKASITRLQKGNLNLAKKEGDIIWKKKLHFKKEYSKDLHEFIDSLKNEISHKERFIVVTDDKAFLAHDTKTDDTLDILLSELPEYFDFFLPWAGIEKTAYQNENPADVKAAEKMAKLFDEIKKDNVVEHEEERHNLNVFLSRILFCLFAEDTGIFDEDVFTNAIGSQTKADGSDLHTFLERLFGILNTPERERGKLPVYLQSFPYVNGGLFEHEIKAPKFTRKSRQAIIAAGTLQWKDINPDIFGSMFQAVIGAEQRGSLGQHYTSVPNIMKVIEPLFLNDLRADFDKAKGKKDYDQLLNRIWNIKIFDPACGSGNFLIIAYKELRKLEIEILQAMKTPLPFSMISLSNFYGIEYDDFAGEIAKLALWLAEHQMNSLFKRTFGKTRPTLPLKEAGQIVHGNACRLDWEEVCPKGEEDEIYILGNPPYVGSKNQTKEQKEDIKFVLSGLSTTKSLDYIACWFIKASSYLNRSSSFSFVSTNSIFQGTQVPLLWPIVFRNETEIYFAYKDFVWKNNAKNNAGVICSIVGIRKSSKNRKYLFLGDTIKEVKFINNFLYEGPDITVKNRSNVLSDFPRLQIGNEAYDSGYLTFTEEEKNEFINKDQKTRRFFKKLVGSRELINGFNRWCLWIEPDDLEQAKSIPSISQRISEVKRFRENGGMNARSCMDRPYQFRWVNRAKESQIILPVVSSLKREYIPMSFFDSDTISINSAQVIFDPPSYIFSIINSKIHMQWVRLFGGKLKNDYRYNAGLCYNTFPFPPITENRKQELTEYTFRILEEREKHPEKTLAELYDPDKMPDGLREAHRLNDLAVERCYRSKPFESDEERLEYLFKLYEQMIQEEKDRDTLFAKEKKGRKNRK